MQSRILGPQQALGLSFFFSKMALCPQEAAEGPAQAAAPLLGHPGSPANPKREGAPRPHVGRAGGRGVFP